MKRILVIKLSALGDVIMADGSLRDIREHHQADEITVLTTPPYRKLLERCPWVDLIMTDRRDSRLRLDRMLKLRKSLREKKFDLVYDLQQVGRTQFYFRWFLPDVDWVGNAKGCLYYRERPAGTSATDHYALHLQDAGVPVNHTYNCDLSWMADNVDLLLQQHKLEPGYTVLIPGASKGHDAKRWPYFRELAQRLLATGRTVVTIPGPEEMELCKTIDGKMLVDRNGSYLDFFKLAGVLKKAGFVIGNDTGPTHIAAHLRVPGIALFSNRIPPKSTGIQHSKFNWIQRDNLTDISVEEVLAALNRSP